MSYLTVLAFSDATDDQLKAISKQADLGEMSNIWRIMIEKNQPLLPNERQTLERALVSLGFTSFTNDRGVIGLL